MIRLLLCLFIINMHAMEKLPKEMWSEIIIHSFDRNALESAKCLIDVYRSLEVCNKLARCNKQGYELVKNFFDQKYGNSEETLKGFCHRKLSLIQDERSDVLSFWHSWRIFWKTYYPPYEKNSWGHKYAEVSYCRITPKQ